MTREDDGLGSTKVKKKKEFPVLAHMFHSISREWPFSLWSAQILLLIQVIKHLWLA